MGRLASGTVGYYHVVDIWSIIRHHDYGWDTCFRSAAIPCDHGWSQQLHVGLIVIAKWDNVPEGMVTSVFWVEWAVQRRGALGTILMEACVVCAA